MKINYLELRQFRQFHDAIVLENFSDGINIFHGPNESGKSTLVQGIRAAFLERHTTRTVSNFRSVGEGSTSPEVILGFEHNGKSYRLSKRFLKDRRIHLVVDSDAIDGDEAESYLSNLLGYSVPVRGGSDSRHWGIPGLLWVNQGYAHELAESVNHAQDSLHAVLSKSVDNISSTDGDAVVSLLQKRLDRLVTPSTMAPKKKYKALLEEHDAVEQELNNLRAEESAYKEDAHKLHSLVTEHSLANKDKPWALLKAQVSELEKQLHMVSKLEAERKYAQDRLSESEITLGLMQDRARTIENIRRDLYCRKKDVEQKRESLNVLKDELVPLEESYSKAKEAYEISKTALNEAQNKHLQHNRAIRIRELKQELKRCEDAMSSVTELQETIAQNFKEFNKCAVTLPFVADINNIDAEIRAIESRINATSARVDLKLESGRHVFIDDKKVDSSLRFNVLESSRIEVPGVAHITIVQDGDDAGTLRRRMEVLNIRLQSKLDEAGVESVAHANNIKERYDSLNNELKHNQKLITAHAPDGIDGLKNHIIGIKDSIETLSLQGASKQINDELPVDLPSLFARHEEIESALQSSEARLGVHRLSLVEAKAALDSAVVEYERISAQVNSAHAEKDQSDLMVSIRSQQQLQQKLKSTLCELDKKIRSARPDILREDISRLTKSSEQQWQAHLQREREIAEMQGRLRTVGVNGIAERLYELEGRLNAINQQLEQYESNIEAMVLLRNIILEHKQNLTQRLQAPLLHRINHYLPLLFNNNIDISANLSDGFMPASITRDRQTMPLEYLSFGTREQISTISRLAYADLLKEAGIPTLIILDDALVHADSHRLSQFKRILFSAAQRHQILIFTCQPNNWQDLGAAPQSIR